MTTAASANSHRYQRWTARTGPKSLTGGWINIATTGFRLEVARRHTRTMVTLAFGFVLGNCVIFYLLSLLETMVGTPEAEGLADFLQGMLSVDLSSVTRLAEMREVLWRTVFLFTFKVQLFWAMIVVARVGPGLIANDLKARALPIYFARPVTPLTYLLGKWMVAAAFIGAVTVVPNLLSLVFGVVITGGLHTWSQTLGLGADLIVVGLGLMVFGGVVIVALSSMTSDSRYITVGWLAFCLLPAMAQSIVHGSLESTQTTGLLGSISLRDDVVVLTEWVFDMREAWEAMPLPAQAYQQALAGPVEPIYPALVLGTITVLAALAAYRRVLRFSRAAANV